MYQNQTMTRWNNGLDTDFWRHLNEAITKSFTTAIHHIKSTAIKEEGRIFVTGYAKIFAEPQESDACGTSLVTPLAVRNRRNVNSAIDLANDVIKTLVQSAGANVEFFDSDTIFNGHRFCEPVEVNNTVWFNDYISFLQYDDHEGIARSISTFHPLAPAHTKIATIMYSKLKRNANTELSARKRFIK